MKKKKSDFTLEKNQKVVKGRNSAMILSIAIHVGAFLLAGTLVVFQIVTKEEKVLVAPPPVDRPKMKLKKPQVKVKKTSKPKSTQRIVSKAKMTGMPELALPEFSGIGMDVSPGLGDFGELPELEEITGFGKEESVGSDLEGTYYDFNRKRSGVGQLNSPAAVGGLISKFFADDWNPNVFSRFYRAPKKLYTTTIALPSMVSSAAPPAFGEPDGKGWLWLVHYRGEVVYHEDITFRFWGFGDDILAVRLNGEMVFLACFPQWITDFDEATRHHWQSSTADNRKYPMSNHHSVVGDWVTLKANEPQEIEILLGESHGGVFSAQLCVEVEGVEYDKNPHRFGPCLPFFHTAKPSLDDIETVYSLLQPGEATMEMGPVFNDYDYISPTSRFPVVYADEPADPPPQMVKDVEPEMRIWTMLDGTEIEAKYKGLVGSEYIVLEKSDGGQMKVLLKDLSPADYDEVMFLNPPRFRMNISKVSNQRMLSSFSDFLPGVLRRKIFDWKFGARVEQRSADIGYRKPLTVGYFIIGKETDGKNYILLQRKMETFVPTKENKGKFEFYGDKEIILEQFAVFASNGAMRGEDYKGYLIVMTDERGNIVQYKTSAEWLFRNVENLKKMPVGRHMNKNCNRVMPDRPGEADRCTWN